MSLINREVRIRASRKLAGSVLISWLVGSDHRTWHRFSADYVALGNDPSPLRLFFLKLTQYPSPAGLVAQRRGRVHSHCKFCGGAAWLEWFVADSSRRIANGLPQNSP